MVVGIAAHSLAGMAAGGGYVDATAIGVSRVLSGADWCEKYNVPPSFISE